MPGKKRVLKDNNPPRYHTRTNSVIANVQDTGTDAAQAVATHDAGTDAAPAIEMREAGIDAAPLAAIVNVREVGIDAAPAIEVREAGIDAIAALPADPEERPTKRQRTMNFIINNQNKLAAGTAVISTGMTLLGIPVTPLVLSAAAASAISYFMERSNLNCKGEAASSSKEHRDDHNRDRDDENNNNPPASTSNRAASILV